MQTHFSGTLAAEFLFCLGTGAALAQSFHHMRTETSSLSEINNQLTVWRMPLDEVVAYLARKTSRPVRLDSRIIEAESWGQTVSMQMDLSDPDGALRELLEARGLDVQSGAADFRIMRSPGAINDTQSPLEWLTPNQALVRRKLSAVVPLHLDHVPLGMLAEFVSGATGLKVELQSDSPLGNSPFGGCVVTLHSDRQPLGEALAAALRPVGKRLELTDSGIRIINRPAAANPAQRRLQPFDR